MQVYAWIEVICCFECLVLLKVKDLLQCGSLASIAVVLECVT
ncbi:hypothetical protein M758_6G021800 [Ceratodon purpureus]|nr:hypothetical protein M758_6G021800 [Ceratodon purpureus]